MSAVVSEGDGAVVDADVRSGLPEVDVSDSSPVWLLVVVVAGFVFDVPELPLLPDAATGPAFFGVALRVGFFASAFCRAFFRAATRSALVVFAAIICP